MSPHRTMPEPCRECARREAEEAVKEAARVRRLAEVFAARLKKPFDWGLFALVGFIVAFLGLIVFSCFDGDPINPPPACYRVVDDNDNGVQLQRAKYYRWTAPSFKNVQAFVSREEADAFMVAKKVRVCR